MADMQPRTGRTTLYRFTQHGNAEAEQRQFPDDDAAEDYARQLSKSHQVPVTIERRDDVDWEYVTEADERS